jgi:hypothetical protein
MVRKASKAQPSARDWLLASHLTVQRPAESIAEPRLDELADGLDDARYSPEEYCSVQQPHHPLWHSRSAQDASAHDKIRSLIEEMVCLSLTNPFVAPLSPHWSPLPAAG